MKLDWNGIWESFDAWYIANNKKAKCKTCHHTTYDEPDWDEQMKAIQRIVEQSLTMKAKRG